MNTRLTMISSLFLVVGCLPPSKSVGESESSGGESQTGGETEDPTSGASMSSSAGTMTDPSASGSSGQSTSTTTDPSMSGSGTTDDPSTSGNTDTGSESGTTQGELCELEPIVCDMVEGGKVLPEDVVDCGRVTLQDDAEAWTQAQQCVLTAFGNTEAYKVFAEQMAIDSNVERALGSLLGIVYQPVEYISDTGGLGSNAIGMRNCSPIVPPDCEPSPGDLCLGCQETEDYDVLCEL